MIPAKGALLTATDGHEAPPSDWMPASQVRALIFDDPALLWLEYHGAQFGFQPDTSPYAFADFIAEKSRQFEAKWLQEMAPAAPVVCREEHEVVCGRRSRHYPTTTLAMPLRVTPIM
jgi:hypothetical protein